MVNKENITQKINRVIRENWGSNNINNKKLREHCIKMLILNPFYFDKIEP